MLITIQAKDILYKKADEQAYDFTATDFTKDDDYHDLDLSEIIPEHSIAVYLWGSMKCDEGGTEINFAQYGHTGEYLKVMRHQPVANVAQNFDCFIPVGPERKIKYRIASSPTYVNINLSIVAVWVRQ